MAQKLVISFSQNLKSPLYFFVWNYSTMTTVNCCILGFAENSFFAEIRDEEGWNGPQKGYTFSLKICSLDFSDFFAYKVHRHRCSNVLCNGVYRRFPLAQNRGKLAQIKRKWSIRSYFQNVSISFFNFCEVKYIRS